MTHKRRISRTRQDVAVGHAELELPPARAFVLHLAAHARPPQQVVGRVEHITSGRVAHVTSLRGLAAFLAEVLCDGGTGN